MKRLYTLGLALIVGHLASGQVTYIPIGSDDHYNLDRLQTLQGKLSNNLRLDNQGVSRKDAVSFLEDLLTATVNDKKIHLSRADKYNLSQMIAENAEWAKEEKTYEPSKHPLFKTFYKTKYNLFEHHSKDFFIVINPVLNVMMTKETNSPVVAGVPSKYVYKVNNFEVRGGIGKKIGFYATFTDIGEQLPAFIYRYAVKDSGNSNRRIVFPGNDYFLPSSPTPASNLTVIQAAGYFDFAAIKDHLNVTFGNGKFFIGDGISSLFLTDLSSNMPFLRLRAHFGKLSYETIYLQMTSQFKKANDGMFTDHKYATVHNLSYNFNRWLNVGFFEAMVADNTGGIRANVMNPVPLSYPFGFMMNAGDNSIWGLSGKILATRKLQFYGQFMVNNSLGKEANNRRSNYFGLQGGLKCFNLLGIKNLDVQIEADAVQPFAYSANDTIANFTNYNQPLADPLGSNFVKTIAVVHFQPYKNITAVVKATNFKQGADLVNDNTNYGGNIFSQTKSGTLGGNGKATGFVSGPQITGSNISVNLSFQIKRNVFFDIGTVYAQFNTPGKNITYTSTIGMLRNDFNTNYTYFGLRINSARRDYTRYY